MALQLSEQVMAAEDDAVRRPGDFVLDRRMRSASLTQAGMRRAVAYLGAPDGLLHPPETHPLAFSTVGFAARK